MELGQPRLCTIISQSNHLPYFLEALAIVNLGVIGDRHSRPKVETPAFDDQWTKGNNSKYLILHKPLHLDLVVNFASPYTNGALDADHAISKRSGSVGTHV